MDSVVHFEMPYENRQRMAKFYQAAFGWKRKKSIASGNPGNPRKIEFR